MKYAALNSIPVNNDLTTFDLDAINWMAAPENNYDDYMTQTQKQPYPETIQNQPINKCFEFKKH